MLAPRRERGRLAGTWPRRALFAVAAVAFAIGCKTAASEGSSATADVDSGDASDASGEAAGESDGAASDAGAAAGKIRYVVVLVKENRTFDNLFGAFPGADGTLVAKLSDGTTLQRPVAPVGGLPRDIDHDHKAALVAYAGGAMNGFDLLPGAHPADGGADDHLPFVYYPRERIPNYYTLAESYSLCDRFFSTTLANTFPGHLSTIAAQSPAYDNPTCPTCGAPPTWACYAPPGTSVAVYNPDTCATSMAPPCFDIPTIVDVLSPGLTWRAYGPRDGQDILTPFTAIRSVGGNAAIRAAHFRDQNVAATDLASGDQENVTYISVSAGEASEHPPEDPCPGENFTVDVVNAVMRGPHWNESAIVITWDDWGGLYDHVAPLVNQGACASGQFFNTGFRVPAIVISPYSKKGYIKHTGAEQASIPRLIEELLGLPRLHTIDPHARDTLAGTLLDTFDFTQSPRAPAPLTPRTCP